VPQIWLDDEELADFIGVNPAQARIHAIQQGWTRIRSRSGPSRSRLPSELTPDYLRFLTQLPPVQNKATHSWSGLRKALTALMQGSGNASRDLPAHSLETDAKSGRSIAAPVLVSENRQSEAA
jgi:hypothetical protein